MKPKKISENKGKPMQNLYPKKAKKLTNLQIARESKGYSQEEVIDLLLKKENERITRNYYDMPSEKQREIRLDDILKSSTIARQTLSNYENNPSIMPVGILIDLSEIYGVTIDYLLSMDELTNKEISRRFGYNNDVISNIERLIKEDKQNSVYSALYSLFGEKLTRNLYVSVFNGVMGDFEHFRELLRAFIFYAFPNQYFIPVKEENGKNKIVGSKKGNKYIINLATDEKYLSDSQEIELDRDFLKAIAKKKLDFCIDRCVDDFIRHTSKNK